MGVSGFLLLAARSTWTEIEKDVEHILHSSLLLDPSSSLEMPCIHADPSCNSKLALYATGFVIGGAALGYFVGLKVAAKKARCNAKIKLECDKVVDSQDIEDVGEKKAYCRCWKSKKFPLCDGSHNAHNKETGDNVGPLIISNSQKVLPA